MTTDNPGRPNNDEEMTEEMMDCYQFGVVHTPGRPNDDGYPAVESNNPKYWRALNELGKQGRLPERIWRKKDEKQI